MSNTLKMLAQLKTALFVKEVAWLQGFGQRYLELTVLVTGNLNEAVQRGLDERKLFGDGLAIPHV